MPEYIEREAVKEHISKLKFHNYGTAILAVMDVPTADVAEVVRCKDCTEWDTKECECSHWYGFRENDFCCHGVRKND